MDVTAKSQQLVIVNFVHGAFKANRHAVLGIPRKENGMPYAQTAADVVDQIYGGLDPKTPGCN